ncbi:MAG TPA: hypothetical protein VJI73_00975 [Candidatus Paceibacterota bacterium]
MIKQISGEPVAFPHDKSIWLVLATKLDSLKELLPFCALSGCPFLPEYSKNLDIVIGTILLASL